MRKKINKQLSIVEPQIHHEHSEELAVIDDLLCEWPEAIQLVYEDSVRVLKDPDKGREGEMSAMQVLKALIVKQQNQFSYKDLQFHLMDSRTYRSFCEFGFADMVPSKTVLHRDISKIRAETLEAINHILLRHAACGGQERGRKVRMDCSVTESNIHAPTDSSLLSYSVSVLCRITQKARNRLTLKSAITRVVRKNVPWEF